MIEARQLDRAIEALPHAHPGPGGAVAVLKDGQVLVRRAWGYADAERGIPFGPATLFRMCSITKQFTCALVLDALASPAALDGAIRDRLPRLAGPFPTALQLCHNQSGLRDYWALAMLHGAQAEQAFGEEEARQVISGARSLQFAPGARYSYANQNFRLLSDLLQDHTGEDFDARLRRRIFDPVGMEHARIVADTSVLPGGAVGYEGAQAIGFRPAVNNILWTGDAGLAATLDDMIAWERHIDATRDDAAALYSRLSAPVFFGDGGEAAYGFGLGRRREMGQSITGHAGALRGWRSHRLYAHQARISVVVLFNHFSDARGAAFNILSAALGEPRPNPAAGPPPPWLGAYLEPQTGLSARFDLAGPGRVRLRFGHAPELLHLQSDGSALGDGVRVAMEASGLRLQCLHDNQDSVLQPLAKGPASVAGLAGRYHCEELDATLTVTDGDGVLYGAFSGFLGQGRMELLNPVGPDVMTLPCWRALDHTPPGEWTLVFRRGPDGGGDVVEVGCWLARRLTYRRAGQA